MSKKEKETEVVVEVLAPVVVEEPEPRISFDRFFQTLGKPAHHKKGMIAFVKNVKGKLTLAAWSALFEGY